MLMKKIIIEPGQGEIIEKKSRFICDLFPIYQEEEIETYLQDIKKQHYNARHHCYGWLFGDNKRFSDNGEPQGSAGLPILNLLEKEGYANILAVVTRYFGGTLLGVGGLSRAYSGAVAVALENIISYPLETGRKISLTFPYHQLGSMEHFIDKNEGVHRMAISYDANVSMQLMIALSQLERVEVFIRDWGEGKIDFLENDLERYIIKDKRVVTHPSWQEIV